MAAVLERIEVEAPVSAAEQLADLRRQIADRVAQRDLALRKQRECEADAVQHQSTIDRVPMFQAKLEELFERKATGDAKAAKEIEAVTKDVETMTEMAGRAKLELHGCRAGAKRFAKEAADADAQIDGLSRVLTREVSHTLTHDNTADRAAHRVVLAEFVDAKVVEFFARGHARFVFAKDVLGLTKSELLRVDLHECHLGGRFAMQTTASNAEYHAGEGYLCAWGFDRREAFEKRVAEIVAELTTQFWLPS